MVDAFHKVDEEYEREESEWLIPFIILDEEYFWRTTYIFPKIPNYTKNKTKYLRIFLNTVYSKGKEGNILNISKQRRRILSVFLFILAILIFALGLEIVGIAVAVIGLFFYPSNTQDPTNEYYVDNKEEEERDDSENDTSGSGDSSGDNSD